MLEMLKWNMRAILSNDIEAYNVSWRTHQSKSIRDVRTSYMINHHTIQNDGQYTTQISMREQELHVDMGKMP